MIWKDIPGWDAFYEASDAGLVRSKDRYVRARNGAKALRKGRELTQIEKNNGYMCVTLAAGKRRPQVSVHRIVARAFFGECPIGQHVLHIDGNRRNNSVSNLRYGTPAENHADTLRHGHRRMGATHPRAKLTEDDVRAIRKDSRSSTALAQEFGISVAHVYQIRARRVWRHI